MLKPADAADNRDRVAQAVDAPATAEGETDAPLGLLIDTCVWLDLAKDYRQRATIGALEQLIEHNVIWLVIPQQVIDEFVRNKDRIIVDSGRSLAGTFRRVRDAVNQFGRPDGKADALIQLDDIDHRITILGGAINESISRIEKMFSNAQIIKTYSLIKELAADRAIEKLAPFHRGKNSIGDALLIETYIELVRNEPEDGRSFAFITHNKNDFSNIDVDERKPHPDIEDIFDGKSSRYSIVLADLLNEVAPGWLEELTAEYEFEEEPRRLQEIMDAEKLLFRQVWYNRHQNLRISIETGTTKVVTSDTLTTKPYYRNDEILGSVWAMAQAAAQRTRDEVGVGNLGPWDDFEWGMLNGKLSALRWVMGSEWDFLDT